MAIFGDVFKEDILVFYKSQMQELICRRSAVSLHSELSSVGYRQDWIPFLGVSHLARSSAAGSVPAHPHLPHQARAAKQSMKPTSPASPVGCAPKSLRRLH